MITNTIPVSQVQVGDMVLYRVGSFRKGRTERKLYKVTKIRDMGNGTTMIYFTGDRDMIVSNKGEVIISV